MNSDQPCGHCGLEEHAHHAFAPIKRPASCVCDWREWGDQFGIRDVCAAHVGDPSKNCETCEHDMECHENGH